MNPTVDLTGLPESVAQGIRQLVRALQEQHTAPAASGEPPGPPGPPAEANAPLFLSRPRPSPEEAERLLDELSSGPPGKVLPPDFSRADIYDDHD